jgi:hypothetical protein
MQILQVPEGKKIVEAYQDGFIRVKELREQLDWYWDKKICKGTKTPIMERTGDLVPIGPAMLSYV